jgi:hypothetical protein
MADKKHKVKAYLRKGKRVRQSLRLSRKKKKVALGLGLAGGLGVGALVLAAKKKKLTNVAKTIKTAPSPSKVTVSVDPRNKPKLVLFASVKHKDLFDRLAKQQKLTEEDLKPLYFATQGIWQGKAGDMSKKLRDSLDSNIDNVKSSAYDLFAIEIDLKKHIPAFDAGKSQLERLDGLKEILNNYETIKVSKRLGAGAASNINGWNR